jgi:hypothetical protein
MLTLGEHKNNIETFYTERLNEGLCEGFLITALQINEKNLNIKAYQNWSQ